MPEIDFTGVGEPVEWTPAPAGDYILQLIDAEDSTIQSGQNAGQPKSSLKFEIVDCEGELEKYNGRTIYYTATYGEKALPVVKQMLRAFGVEVEDGKMAFEWDELIGLKLQASVKSTPKRQDKTTGQEYGARNEIRRFLVPTEGSEA